MSSIWLYRETITGEQTFDANALVGFDVEATDGHIGTIDEASTEADRSHIVVDTGFWIFGKKRVIPAGTVVGMDHEARRVVVSMTKDQVKAAPDYDESDWADEDTRAQQRARHGEYYTPYSGR